MKTSKLDSDISFELIHAAYVTSILLITVKARIATYLRRTNTHKYCPFRRVPETTSIHIDT